MQKACTLQTHWRVARSQVPSPQHCRLVPHVLPVGWHTEGRWAGAPRAGTQMPPQSAPVLGSQSSAGSSTHLSPGAHWIAAIPPQNCPRAAGRWASAWSRRRAAKSAPPKPPATTRSTVRRVVPTASALVRSSKRSACIARSLRSCGVCISVVAQHNQRRPRGASAGGSHSCSYVERVSWRTGYCAGLTSRSQAMLSGVCYRLCRWVVAGVGDRLPGPRAPLAADRPGAGARSLAGRGAALVPTAPRTGTVSSIKPSAAGGATGIIRTACFPARLRLHAGGCTRARRGSASPRSCEPSSPCPQTRPCRRRAAPHKMQRRARRPGDAPARVRAAERLRRRSHHQSWRGEVF